MIKISGYGIVSAIGIGTDDVMASLQAGCTGIGPMRHLPSRHSELPVGEVRLSNDDMKLQLGIQPETIVSRTTLMGALAIRQAMQHAGWPSADKEQRERSKERGARKGRRVVVINGTTVGGMDVTEHYYQRMLTDDRLLPLFAKHDCGSTTREMADLAGLKDAEVCTISTACSSALNAIILGAEMLKQGEADVVIAGGAEALTLFHLNGFHSLMILDPRQCRPFDKERAGLNLGEGAAFVVMTASPCPSKVGENHNEKASSSSANDATRLACSQEKRSDAAPTPSEGAVGDYAFIVGYANHCDAFHQTASSPQGEGAYLAMRDAIRMAGLRPNDIHYVNAHGTGTPNNDASESEALRRVFGPHMPPVSSTKGFTGHTTSASGAIETVISIMALQQGFIPMNLGFSTHDEACITPSMVNNQWPMVNVLCNSFGFGGNDSSLIISTKPAATTDGPRYEGEISVLADVTLAGEEELTALREMIPAGEVRRMSKLMKAATVTSLRALGEAGVAIPDAIITATAYGMLETSRQFLSEMLANEEEMLSPTRFIGSTHNTLSAAIAIRTGCHGYNMTYTCGADSLRWAMRDARRLIATGQARTVLVGCHDELTPMLLRYLQHAGKPIPPALYSRSIILSKP